MKISCAQSSKSCAEAMGIQVEMLDRLLDFNHERYAEDVRQCLHAEKKAKPTRTRNTGQRSPLDGPVQLDGSLF